VQGAVQGVERRKLQQRMSRQQQIGKPARYNANNWLREAVEQVVVVVVVVAVGELLSKIRRSQIVQRSLRLLAMRKWIGSERNLLVEVAVEVEDQVVGVGPVG